ncbi:MAG: HtaA domain-containing protein [Pseudomonadales bacterium]|nr:HtaA domain-containing protein [Pseudomonadales bacterium]MBO6597135.1 HtaA domain-containing protein [Pseudomonadales bacterium]MBO6655358.1 HtaA domain-containing protein [Pseudomonadales bacterium]MBO6703766.1 HtaA domain-containing protein [Pseudomonadales bacterium]MBO6823678.1 HtaA domain-containing protein [Pseudomonadales bacterium]
MSFNKLTWGVKASFRSYVEAAGGSVTLGDGATRADDGAFVFNAVPGGDLEISPDGSASGSMRFEGSVTFDAHGGMLKSTLAELGIESGEDGLVITVLEAPMNQGRCAIAKLECVASGEGEGVTLRSEITMDGMWQIADNYPPGTELDSVQLD